MSARLVTVCIAVILLLSAPGCMIHVLLDKAYDRYPDAVSITKIHAAAVHGQDLFLQLDVESGTDAGTEPVILRVPLEDLRTYRREKSPGIELMGVDLGPPYLGVFDRSPSLPEDARRVPVTYHTFQSYQEERAHLHSLSPGMHVIISPRSRHAPGRSEAGIAQDGSIPPKGHLTLVERTDDGEVHEQSMYSFSEARRKQRGWLFLTPLTVVGDIITFPLQVIMGLIIEC